MRDNSLKIIKDISEIVNSTINMSHLLDVIIATATRIMNAKASSLLLIDEKTGKLFFHIATGEKKEEVKLYELSMGEGIAGWVAEHGTPVLTSNVKEDPRWSSKISNAIGFSTSSIACAPLKVGDTVLGVIEIIDHLDQTSLTQEDLDMLCAFADIAALSILRARIFSSVNMENERLREALVGKFAIVGESPIMKKIISDCSKVAHSTATALITGGSGTGKELIARFIHNSSPRKSAPYITVNCGALPETLLESELFGYEKGAFTGAYGQKTGLFEAADKGTIFLDEIGETSLGMQVKLLRVLQEGTITRVGGTRAIKVDVRVIAATNRDIEERVQEKDFRDDLYYRLNVVRIKLPTLSERKEDIPSLAKHFLEKFQMTSGSGRKVEGISPEAMEVLVNYDWPGNIRQLENVIELAVIMGATKDIKPADLPREVCQPTKSNQSAGLTLKDAQDNFKRDFIRRTLESVSGSKTKAATVLDVQRTYLSRLIKELGV
ncbi:MAG: sigma 54-interacting transcriptional regulator [Nitrospinae bacterium]|nr:sigma 54-interacting transcriptional regulator [Nitrospinota bacterium]